MNNLYNQEFRTDKKKLHKIEFLTRMLKRKYKDNKEVCYYLNKYLEYLKDF